MSNTLSAIEKIIKTIERDGAVFEVVERPDVIWVGTVAYAENNADEPDIKKLLRRYRRLVPLAPKENRINEDWDASISINYSCDNEKPKGIMFAQETYSAENQDKRYNLLTQPAGLYMRIYNDTNAAKLIGKDKCETYELFGLLKKTAKQNGYNFNGEVSMEIEYHNWKDNSWYAYIPVV